MKPFILNRNDCRDISKGLEDSGARGWFKRESPLLLELATLFRSVDCEYVEVRQDKTCLAYLERNK